MSGRSTAYNTKVILVAALLSVLIFRQARAAEAKVGVIISSGAGPYADAGREIVRAIPIGERARRNLVVIREASNPTDARAATKMLIDVERVSSVIVVSSPAYANAVRDAIGARPIVFVSMAPEHARRNDLSPFRFHFGTTIGTLVSRAASFASMELRARAPILYASQSVLTRTSALAELFPGANARRQDPLVDVPFERFVAQLAEDKPDVLLVSSDDFLQRGGELASRPGLSLVVFSLFGLAPFANSSPAQHVYVVAAAQPLTDEGKKFAAEYARAYGAPARFAFTYQAIAVIEILSQASARSIGFDDIADALHSNEFATILGRIRFDAEGEANGPGEAVWELGRWGKPLAEAGGGQCKCVLEDCCRQTCCKQCDGTCKQ